MDFDISTPVDVKKATETLCGSPVMFYTMLSKFEDMTFLNLMREIAKAVERGDMEKLMHDAHQLKSPAGYIGASHIHYACYFIQEHHAYKRYKEMLEYYPTLVEAAVEFRIHSRILLAKN
jgi:HPt (histidine-containing phosphotransfer) domain-containing protein